jgi:hypothetical protein
VIVGKGRSGTVGTQESSPPLTHKVPCRPCRLVQPPPIRIGVIDHANQDPARREQAATGLNRSANVARVVQTADCYDRIERAIREGRLHNITLGNLA